MRLSQDISQNISDTKVILSSLDSHLSLSKTNEEADKLLSEFRTQIRSYMDICRRDIERFADQRNGLAAGAILAIVGATSIFTKIPTLISSSVAIIAATSLLNMHLTYALKLEEAKTLEQFWSGFTTVRIAPEHAWRWMPSSGLKAQRIMHLAVVYGCAWGLAIYQSILIDNLLISYTLTLLLGLLFCIHSYDIYHNWKEKVSNHSQRCKAIMDHMNEQVYPEYLAIIQKTHKRVSRLKTARSD